MIIPSSMQPARTTLQSGAERRQRKRPPLSAAERARKQARDAEIQAFARNLLQQTSSTHSSVRNSMGPSVDALWKNCP